jgi:antitoxin ParD1/3/4
MPRNSQPVTVTLGKFKEFVDERVASGRYGSASEVVRAGLRALNREEAALNDWMRAKIKESLDDPRPSSSLEEVFARLTAHHEDAVARDQKRG